MPSGVMIKNKVSTVVQKLLLLSMQDCFEKGFEQRTAFYKFSCRMESFADPYIFCLCL